MTEHQIEQASDRALNIDTNRRLDAEFEDKPRTPEDYADFMEDENV